MNRYRILCATFALSLLSLHSPSVADELNKEVRVTRAYVPQVETATKLSLTPDTSDDSYITPDIDYSITPLSINTTFESELYAPIKLTLDEYYRPKTLYVKAGIGLPIASEVDIYASTMESSKGYIIGYLNQEGRYADIENDFGVKEDASKYRIRAGVAGGLFLGSRILEGDIEFNNSRWSRYAAPTETTVDKNPTYSDVAFSGRYGDNFTNLERFNFDLGVNANYFTSKSDYTNTSFGVNGRFGKSMLDGDMIFSLGFNSISGEDDYSNNTFNIGAKYSIEVDKVMMSIGLEYLNDNVSYMLSDDDSDSYLIPSLDFSLKIADESFILYTLINGQLRHNDYASLSGVNPYITPGYFADKSSVDYAANIGFKGSFADDRLGYNIFAGYGLTKNRIYWAVSSDYMYVNSSSNQSNFNINVELEYKPISNLLFQLDFMSASYSDDDDQLYANFEPSTTLNFDCLYNVGRWNFGINTELLSSREYSTIMTNADSTKQIVDQSLSSTMDLGVSVDYKLNEERAIIFVELGNLLNNDLYNWAYYREYGTNVMLGVKVQF